jgi:hypothetical protein
MITAITIAKMRFFMFSPSNSIKSIWWTSLKKLTICTETTGAKGNGGKIRKSLTQGFNEKVGIVRSAWCLRTGAGQIIPYQIFFVKHFC